MAVIETNLLGALSRVNILNKFEELRKMDKEHLNFGAIDLKIA